MNLIADEIKIAADAIDRAAGILIGAGAGMGVDSGLPDFRGNEGFWEAYPPMKKLGLSFYDLANPVWFNDDPSRAWGFYGHRRNLYRQTQPHTGFEILRRWVRAKSKGGFVFTSNVDGHFQKAGFDEASIVECHGAINFDQCARPCCDEIWNSSENEIGVDLATFKASQPFPKCKHCDAMARPNILMFGDFSWQQERTERQYKCFSNWLNQFDNGELVVIELGAGTAVPTVRSQCEQISRRLGARLIRINPRESQGNDVLAIAKGAFESLSKIDAIL